MNHSAGFGEAPGSGLPVAPPPPPPPPVPGQVPALRISTSSEAGPRKPQPSSFGEAYEPPAAIQNAMMTKDKKPFTYTPGMGGKLDLSQIRSPRMARRVAKNAEDEGIDGPPKHEAGATSPLSPSIPQANVYAPPQVAVPVFPQGQQPAAVNLRNATLPRTIIPVIERQEPVARPTVRIESRVQPAANAAENQSPTPPTSPTQVTLSKAPTPWMQKPLKQQEELPEWAKRTANRQDSNPGFEYQPQTPSSPQPRQIIVVNTPNKPQQQPQFVPQQQMRPVRQEENIIIPRIEDRPSVFSAMNEPGQHHQLMNSTPHHMSRWGNPVGITGQPTPVQTQGGVYVIPVQVDGQQNQNNVSSPVSANNYNPMQYQNQGNRNVQRNYTPAYDPQPEPGPVQSKSFRVLQKITDTDAEEIDGEQIRKLQLTEDDKYLMNKFKEQVDGDGTYLHKEEDPRYRGSAIPSKAFRYLQNMTDSGDGSNANTTVPRPVNSAPKKPFRNFNTFEEVPNHVHVPASQQQVPEPKKYTGGAIPSRSFRILQAMTAPESIGSQRTYDSSPTPSSCTTTNSKQSEILVEKQSLVPSSPIFSQISDNETNREEEDEEDEDAQKNECSFPKQNNLEKSEEEQRDNASTESSDSDSYLAHDKSFEYTKTNVVSDEDDTNSTTVSVSLPSRHKFSMSNKSEDYTVIIGDRFIAKNVDTCVNFTLKHPSHQDIPRIEDSRNVSKYTPEQDVSEDESAEEAPENEDSEAVASGHVSDNKVCVKKIIQKYDSDSIVCGKNILEEEINETLETSQKKPTLVVTTIEDQEENKFENSIIFNTNNDDATGTLLNVQTHSKEEVTDDEDSGVTSDISRIISEVDTDSECNFVTPAHNKTVPVVKRSRSKYQRTQTHSRLFKLLTDEQLSSASPSKLSNHDDISSISSRTTSPDLPHLNQTNGFHSPRPRLPPRPKSLDIEALYNRQGNDSYYQAWKSGDQKLNRTPMTFSIRTHTKVSCPRTNSAKNIPQILALRINHQTKYNDHNHQQKHCMSSRTITPSIPSPPILNKHC